MRFEINMLVRFPMDAEEAKQARGNARLFENAAQKCAPGALNRAEEESEGKAGRKL